MNKHLRKIMAEEKEVFSFNIIATQKELNRNIKSFIKNINDYICNIYHTKDVKTINKMIINELYDKLINLNSNFIGDIANKRKQILNDYITNNVIYNNHLENDEDINNLLDKLRFYQELDRIVDKMGVDNENIRLSLYSFNDYLFDKTKEDIYKIFESLLNYLNDIAENDAEEDIFTFIINQTNKTIYYEIEKSLSIEKDNFILVTNNYKKDLIESLKSITPIEKRKDISEYINSNYTNIINSIYIKYINFINNEIQKIITTNKYKGINDLSNLEKPFLELAKKNSKPKKMDSDKLNEPIIYNLSIKIFGTYIEEDYEVINNLISSYMNELNKIMLEKVENIPNIIVDITLREKKDSLDMINKLKENKLTKESIIKRFKEQEIIDKNLSSDNFRI